MPVHGMDSRRAGRTLAAFTLIELLVAVSIIVLLVGIMLPSLAQARQQARLARCLSNLHQIGNTMSAYFAEYNDAFPWFDDRAYRNSLFIPCLDAWYYGGRYPLIDPYEGSYQLHTMMRYYPEQRPFNRYLYAEARGPNTDTPLYHCPDDPVWDPPFGHSVPWRAYDSFGTSYPANVLWQRWSGFTPSYAFSKSFADYGNQLTRYKLNVRGAATFVILLPYQLTHMLMESSRPTPRAGHHGRMGFNELLFLDGHAEYLFTDVTGGWRARHSEWTLWFSEPDYQIPPRFRPPFPGIAPRE
jgi:competence protein ComGC